MVRAVADTHALVWAVFNDARLSPAARSVFESAGSDQIAVSAISIAEIVYLVEKGRLAPDTIVRLKSVIAGPTALLVVVPVDAGIVDAMARVPRAEVPDLPDRLIAGTALHLAVPLVSRDAKIRASSVATIW